MSRPSERRPISISNPTSNAGLSSRPNGTTSPTKPTIATPRLRTAATGGARQQSNVGAKLLNKRQSVSYHAAIAGGITLPLHVVPGVPSLPTIIPPPMSQLDPGRGGGGGGDAGREVVRAVSPAGPRGVEQLASTGFDVDMLASEGFKPDDFLKEHLETGRGDAPTKPEELRKLRTRLEGAIKITEEDLQRSVFKNYADFVVISKEIATLENEMLELKSVLEEWRTVPASLESGFGDDDLLLASSSGSPANRRTQRNSIADLATLYKSQLSALWDGVEGSQKLLPYIAGRHLIAESASFLELNATTYKPKQPVHLFLLNDAMLVSVKKRRGTGLGGKVRLVAERCFNLSEIVVVDLKDGGDLNNAVKIKRGKETIIFRTDKAEDKRVLLLAFKKVAEELMNKKRKEMLSEAEGRKGDSSNLRGMRVDYDGSLPSLGFSPAAVLGFGKDDPSGKDLSWIGDFADELAVSIATRTFEEAVDLVERGKILAPQLASDPQASFLFRAKLDAGASELITALLHDLSDHSIRKTGVVRTTASLLRLGQAERARETFLSGRGTLVRKRVRQIKFEGDVSLYISELAMVSFTLVKNTCEWYMAAFKDNRMASGFVRWASEQVEIYAETFRRQVYGADQDDKVIEESLEVTKSHGAMLRDVGLDFSFQLEALLRPQLSTTTVPTQGEIKVAEEVRSKSAVAQARQSIFIQNGSLPGSDGKATKNNLRR